MGDVQGAVERRRHTLENARAATAKQVDVRGKTIVFKAGESLQDVTFPLWFVDEPHLTGSAGVLEPNQVLEDGNFPTWQVGVKEFTKARRGASDFYTGATLIIVCTGAADMRSRVHWTFSGLAVPAQL